jgi:adenylate cyclase
MSPAMHAAPRPLRDFAHRHPFLSLFGLAVLSNVAGSLFNVAYNQQLIVARHLDAAQQAVFQNVALPAYNVLAYPLCFGALAYLVAPLRRCRAALRRGETVSPDQLARCRRRLVNLPFHVVWLNFCGWFPGAFFFPALICGLGGAHRADAVWLQFIVSFSVSALLTTAQTVFIVEPFLIAVLYPDFFADARPAEVRGVARITFGQRLLLLWTAVAVMPAVALLAVALNLGSAQDVVDLRGLALSVALVGTASGGLIFWLVGRDVLRWVRGHAAATQQVAEGNFDVRVPEKRPDEWGRLTDRFNDMAAALGVARQVRETFGQFVSPEVLDEIMRSYTGLGGAVQEVTVLFADIRGFTRRSAGADPTAVVALLNEFMTLAVSAVETKGGWVNKFLGDGVMALFGAPRPRHDHADLAVAAAVELWQRLQHFNDDLAKRGEAPLAIGVGIHTGPALVGCVGATLPLPGGGNRVRLELTAIGETVNLAQRVEQLTKHHGPILVSDATRRLLQRAAALDEVGPQTVAGFAEAVLVYRVRPG